jgi:hypothetical protein
MSIRLSGGEKARSESEHRFSFCSDHNSVLTQYFSLTAVSIRYLPMQIVLCRKILLFRPFNFEKIRITNLSLFPRMIGRFCAEYFVGLSGNHVFVGGYVLVWILRLSLLFALVRVFPTDVIYINISLCFLFSVWMIAPRKCTDG